MKVAVRIAQAGNQILNIIVMGIILFLFLYGGDFFLGNLFSGKRGVFFCDLCFY